MHAGGGMVGGPPKPGDKSSGSDYQSFGCKSLLIFLFFFLRGLVKN
jgi:hypothetical protein